MTTSQWVSKARAMSRHLRTGFDAMMRESELEEMQKLWAAQNDAIMKASQLPENSLPNLAGPVPSETSYDPWPTASDVPALPEPQADIAAAPQAKPKRQRKPRAKPPAEAEAGAAPQSDAA
jgi:sec-independent protein translocase protein TatB